MTSKVSNNKYQKCPARMDDGRHFTDYRPNCYLDTLVSIPSKSNYEARQFMIHNGSDIMKANYQNAYQKNSCGPCSNKNIYYPKKESIAGNEVAVFGTLTGLKKLMPAVNLSTYTNNTPPDHISFVPTNNYAVHYNVNNHLKHGVRFES